MHHCNHHAKETPTTEKKSLINANGKRLLVEVPRSFVVHGKNLKKYGGMNVGKT